MTLNYRVESDSEARASYLYLLNVADTRVKRTDELGHGVFIDRNAAGDVIGFEWLWGPESAELRTAKEDQ